MAIRFSEYIRQGKKTFRFGAMSGGAYGANISYAYGYFNGSHLDGIRFSYNKHTEFESDPDEKDGIGGMIPVVERSLWIGSFTDGKKNGFCSDLTRNCESYSDHSCFFDMDSPLTLEEYKARSEKEDYDEHEVAYYDEDTLLVCCDGEPVYMGQLYDESKPYFCKIYAEGELVAHGFRIGNEEIPFIFDSWEPMPVDPVDEDGFSVLREMTFFSDGDLRYKITEGLFAGGKLNGFGTAYYNSHVNGYHTYTQESGIFRDGELFFGYRHSYENTGGSRNPTSFGYRDGRDLTAFGAEIVYEGKRYIGDTVDGVPCGIGCLYESDDKMLIGSFQNGKAHGIGATYKLIDGKWLPYDFVNDRKDESYDRRSWGIFANGEFQPTMTWEEFFDTYAPVKKV